MGEQENGVSGERFWWLGLRGKEREGETGKVDSKCVALRCGRGQRRRRRRKILIGRTEGRVARLRSAEGAEEGETGYRRRVVGGTRGQKSQSGRLCRRRCRHRRRCRRLPISCSCHIGV